MITSIFQESSGGPETMGEGWGWFLATGVAVFLLGILTLSMPVVSTLGLTLWVGAVLFVGGIIRLFHAVKLRHFHGGQSRFFQSVVSIVIGALMLRYPGGGMIGVALALSVYFFLSAATQWIIVPGMGRHKVWGVVSGVVSFLMGVFMIVNFPFSALWVPGLFLGIELIVAGGAMIGFSFSLRRLNVESRGRGRTPPFQPTESI